MNVYLQLIIFLIASLLSLSVGQNELDKQIAALKIKIDRQDAELKQLKSNNDMQNEKLSVLNKLNNDLQQELLNHSDTIIVLQKQLENLIFLSQNKSEFTELDGSGFQQEIFGLLNTSDEQQRQIEYLMAQGRELKKNDTKLHTIQQIMQADIDVMDVKFNKITDDQYKQIENLGKQNERLQGAIQLNQNKSIELISTLNESQSKEINEQENEIMNIKRIIDQGKLYT